MHDFQLLSGWDNSRADVEARNVCRVGNAQK
jgi:hypothetical protein